MPDLTPTQLHALVAPLRDAIGERWPKRGDVPLSLADFWNNGNRKWSYVDGMNIVSCDDQTAAERLEFAVDRTLEAEAKKLDCWVRIRTRLNDDGTGAYVDVIRVGIDNVVDGVWHENRFVAKCDLLGRLVGVEVKA